MYARSPSSPTRRCPANFNPTNVLPAPGTPVRKHMDFSWLAFDLATISLSFSTAFFTPSSPTPDNPPEVIPVEPKKTNTVPTTDTETTEEETDVIEDSGDNSEEEVEPSDTSTMKVGEGKIHVDAETSDNSPIQVAYVETSIDELVNHSDIFTENDVEVIKNGADARVWVNVNEMDLSLLPMEKQAEVQKIAESLGDDDMGLLYFDITLLKQVGDGDITSIHEPGIDIEVSIEVPKEIRNTNPDVKREYSVIRVHDGKVENLGGKYDEETGIIVFKTGKFSTYVLAYADTPIISEEIIPDNSEETNNNTWLWVVLGLILLLGAGFAFFMLRRKEDEE